MTSLALLVVSVFHNVESNAFVPIVIAQSFSSPCHIGFDESLKCNSILLTIPVLSIVA